MNPKLTLEYWKPAIAIWFEFYRAKTGQEYIFDGMQGKHLKQLLGKIKTKVIQAGMEPTSENILNSLKGFLSHLNDSWILEHLEISLINSKFNILYAKAINGNRFTTNKKQQNDSDIGAGVAEHYRKKFAERGLKWTGG